MIEINLVPDVKQELLRAERVRSIVVSVTILIGIISVGIVLALGLWVFGVQVARGAIHDNNIETESRKLLAVEDLENSLTIQNQLRVLPSLHENKYIDSRLFDMLTTIIPASPNEVTISKTTVSTEDRTISIEAQAAGGYSALEAFKKTIEATEFRFATEDGEEVRPLAPLGIRDGERSYGENSEGRRVLRFSLTFEYPEELFMPYLTGASIVGPDGANVTDSSLGIPRSLFAPQANDAEEN